MRNISRENLQFLSDVIRSDYTIMNKKDNLGFTNTVIDNIDQTNNLNFNSKQMRLVRNNLVNNTTTKYLPLFANFLVHSNGNVYFYGNISTGSYSSDLYVWDGETMIKKSLSPISISRSSGYTVCVVEYIDHKIHIISDLSYDKHYTYDPEDDSIEVIEDTLPFTYPSTRYLKGVVYNNKIHLFIASGDTYLRHYSWDATNGWTEEDNLPFIFQTYGSTVSNIDFNIVVYKNKIHFTNVVEPGNSSTRVHYTWDSNGYNKVYTYTDENITNATYSFVYNNYIIIYKNQGQAYYWDDNNLFSLETGGSNSLFTIYYHVSGNGMPLLFVKDNNIYAFIIQGFISYDSVEVLMRWAGSEWLFTKPVYYIEN